MSAPPARPLVLVVSALLRRGDRWLLNQRIGGPLHGKWEFPGGKVEPGEDLRAALVRECREELGVAVLPGAVAEVLKAPLAEKDVLLIFYHTEILDGGEPTGVEGNPLAWVHPRDFDRYDILETDRPLLALLHQLAGPPH